MDRGIEEGRQSRFLRLELRGKPICIREAHYTGSSAASQLHISLCSFLGCHVMGSQLKSDFTLMNENKLYQIRSKEKNTAFDALSLLGKQALFILLV